MFCPFSWFAPSHARFPRCTIDLLNATHAFCRATCDPCAKTEVAVDQDRIDPGGQNRTLLDRARSRGSFRTQSTPLQTATPRTRDSAATPGHRCHFLAKIRIGPPITEHDLPTPRDPPCYLATVFARSTRHASITTLRHATATSSIKSPGRVCSRCSFVTCP